MSSDYSFWPTMTLLIGSIAWIIGTGLRRGSVLSPYSLTLFILVSIFGIRPLLMLDEPASLGFYGYNISIGFLDAALLGFAGTISFIAGAFFWRIVLARRQSEITTVSDFDPVPDWAPRRAAIIAWGLGFGWLSLMIAIGGSLGFLETLFAGRSETVAMKLENVPGFVGALPAVGCVTIASVRFKYEQLQRYTKSQNLHYWLVAAASIIPPSALGTRRYLIPCLVIALMGALANNWNKRIKASWIVLGVTGFLALAIVPFVRSAGSRMNRGESNLIDAMVSYFQDEGLRGTLNNFFLSYDTEMFNYVAYLSQVMGKDISFGFGRGTIGDIITMPLPGSMAPFPRWSDYLLTQTFGSGCGYQSACPVPSIVGILFSDFALPGLILGMVALGIMSERFEPRMLISTSSSTAAMLLVAGFSVAFVRGNSLAQAWIAVQCFVIWWALDRLFLNAGKRAANVSPLPARLHQ